jgi:hypothetical protein
VKRYNTWQAQTCRTPCQVSRSSALAVSEAWRGSLWYSNAWTSDGPAMARVVEERTAMKAQRDEMRVAWHRNAAHQRYTDRRFAVSLSHAASFPGA